MAKDITIGFTDYTTTVFIPDPASTDGSGKTGLVAANLTVSGTRVETDNDVTVTDYTSSLNDLAALTSAHTDWGIKEVSSTLAPGLYRIDIADAIFAAGAWSAVVYVMITTSAAAASPIEFTLVGFNPLDGVRMGLTALPNAAADAAGGLIISDAGGLDADAQRADVAAILVDTGTTLDARIPAALVGGRMDASVGAMAANVQTAASTAADYITEVQSGLSTLDAAGVRTAVGLASANLDTQIAAVQSDTNDLQTRVPAALVGGRMDSTLSAIGNDTTALAAFKRAVLGNVIGTCDAGSTTTSIVTSALTPAGAAADQLKGRIVVFDKDTTTAALRGQATDITASTNAATPTLTVTALTTAPASGDTFVIV